MKKKLVALVAAMAVAWCGLYAQVVRCGTPDRKSLSDEDLGFAQAAAARAGKVTGAVRTIPVAVHVLFSNPGDANNISDAQIQNQIDILNDDYAGGSGGVDTEVRFCLAGINRVQDAAYSVITLGSNDVAMKALYQEDPATYLNCWIVDFVLLPGGAEVLGYSTFPNEFSAHPELDGVIIADHYFGSTGTASGSSPFDGGRTATHEFGHWLNLFHVFQGGCDDSWTCSFRGDCCCDTPPQDTSYFKCKTNKNSCHGDNPDEKDPIRNYMGYSDDDCMREFTDCQKTRMLEALDRYRPGAFFTSGDCPAFKRGEEMAAAGFWMNVYPNPAPGEATVVVEVEAGGGRVVLEVVDCLGRRVDVDGAAADGLGASSHEVSLKVPVAGVYTVRGRMGSRVRTVRLVSSGNGR